MIASVHVADLGALGGLKTLATKIKPATTPGLRQANVAVAAPLGKVPPRPMIGRAALVALWDDDEALDRYRPTRMATEIRPTRKRSTPTR